MLEIGIPYLVCLLHAELCRVASSLGYSVDGTNATNSSQSSGSPSLPFCHASWVDVLDVWVWSPLVMNGTSCGSGGEEVKKPILPRNIPNVGSELSLQFYLYGINSEVPNHSSCS
jgi:hypothetical protein